MAKIGFGLPGKKVKAAKPLPYGKEPATPTVKSNSKYKAPRIAKNEFYKNILSQVFKWVGYLILFSIAVYFIFAVTIVRFIPTLDASVGYAVPVKNITFPGGKAPVGAEVVVNMATPQGISTFDRLKQSVTPATDLAIVQVLGGPSGRITWAETGLVAVDGTPLSTPLLINPNKEFLENEYIVRCIAGSCEKNSGTLVSAGNIYGEPLNDYNLEG